MLVCKLPEPRIELANLFDWMDIRPPRKPIGGQDARQYDSNVIRPCEIDHGANVVFEVIGTGWARICGQIVRACHDVNSVRMQRHNVLVETQQHLGTGLSADAPIYHALSE